MERIKLNINISIDENLKQEMLKEFYSYPRAVEYVKKLGIPDEIIEKYIAKIYDFVLDSKYCDNCPGIKACGKDEPTLCTKLTYVNGIVDRELTLCKKALKKIEADNYFKVADFPNDWLDANIASIDNVQADLARKEAVSKILGYANKKYDGWIYLTGSQNSGRSYITAVLCNKLLAEKDLGPIAFLNSGDRIKELTDYNYSKEKDKFEETLDLYSNIPVLVLDDFGNGYINDYVRDAIIHPIIAKRAQKRLLTIFISDYSIDEIAALFTTNQNAGAIKAEQIRKVIKALCGKEINLGNLSIY